MMAEGILSGMSIVEGSAFVAAPLGGMTLAQLGADVIRFDPIGGGLDQHRWPLSKDGNSLFWAGLNKGKRSLQVDLKSAEGQEIVSRLITRPGPEHGYFLTNLPQRGALAYEALRVRRDDLIMVAMTGNPDGTSEVDYTVNAATGFPEITGPRGSSEPVNSVLPAWDIAMGEMAAIGLLAADRHRGRTGLGSLVRLSLSDIAFAMTAHLGRLAQAELGGAAEKDGNYLYGAFGKDFVTADGRRVMVMALTARQWKALRETTGISVATDVDLATESGRYAAREAIGAALKPWIACRGFDEVSGVFTQSGISWGPYQTFRQLLDDDPRASTANPMFQRIHHPGIGALLTPASPLDFSSVPRLPARSAPKPGEHTDEILAEIGFSTAEIGSLHDRKVVAGP